jgi:hypothetical protein
MWRRRQQALPAVRAASAAVCLVVVGSALALAQRTASSAGSDQVRVLRDVAWKQLDIGDDDAARETMNPSSMPSLPPPRSGGRWQVATSLRSCEASPSVSAAQQKFEP